ncbi:MlaD family protein [Paraconexibacter algicola]|uniref:Mce/MlaD domain-containing protein n=1 Tax=Paraconexibacter algicola TaxID=2133960 RepID=A0A2T4UL23_9ACTN|nr:MlaD family protein [Paraconexibacter algicola]PTL59946.1 hypothetical protein C7Y72_09965 [Paraconexibacter algicola]
MSGRRQLRARRAARVDKAVGLVTAVVLLLIAVVAFRANSGVPLERSYRVTVDVPNAARLIKTSDVRIGGVRVGQVQETSAVAEPDGTTFTRLILKLEEGAGPLPSDSRAAVRPGAILGASYLALEPGRSRTTIPDGGRLPEGSGRNAVELTDLLDVFDRRTAQAMQESVVTTGDGFAGRGAGLNETLGRTAGMLPPLSRVAGALADPETRLAPLIVAADRTSAAFLPVAGDLAGLVRSAATTLEAVARERRALGSAIDRAPRAITRTTRAFTDLAPALAALRQTSIDLTPVVRRLPATLRRTNSALRAGRSGVASLRRTATPLRTAFVALDALARVPQTDGVLRKAAGTFAALGTLFEVLTPAQVHCNVVGLWAEGWAGTFAALGSGGGPGVANLVITSLGANGEILQQARPSSDAEINYLPNADAQECESGNSPSDGRQHLGNRPGLQSPTTRETVWPADARDRADRAGLLDEPVGGGR